MRLADALPQARNLLQPNSDAGSCECFELRAAGKMSLNFYNYDAVFKLRHGLSELVEWHRRPETWSRDY